MEFKYFETSPVMRYWQPDSDKGVEADILENPDKYSNYLGSFKMDGEFSRVIKDGDRILIQSRSISKKTSKYAEKQESLPHLVEAFKNLPDKTVICGEVCYDELNRRSKDVGSVLRSLTDLAIEKQADEKNKLHFYLFDVICWEGEDLMDKGFAERITYFDKVKSCMNNNKYIRYAEIKSVYEIVNEYQDYLDKGGEGFVLQKKTAKYTPGKRPAWETIKLKKCTDEIELKVVGVIEPEEEYTGKELENWKYFKNGKPVTKYFYNGWKAGVVVDFNGKLVRAASGCGDDDAQWLATKEAAEAIKNGTLYAKIEGMEIEKDSGSIRHPRLKNVSLRELRTDI